MSDLSQGPGTTSVLPPAGPGGPPATGVGAPPPPPPSGGGVPIWVVIVVAVAVAAVAGTGMFLWSQSTAAQERARIAELELAKAQAETGIGDLETRIASATAAAVAAAVETVPATVTPPITPKPPAVVTVKNLALVKKVTWSSAKGYQVVADYVQLLTGKAAADAAAAAGEESPPPNDYFIVNSSTKLRTLGIAKTCPVYVLNWMGASGTKLTKIPLGQFMDIMPTGMNPQEPWVSGYYWLTVKSGTTITKVEQQYFP